MAKPIRNTPILIGRDAIQFRKEISELPTIEERRKERQRVYESAYNLINKIASLPK